MEHFVRELGIVKQKIRRLETRIKKHGAELATLKARRDELEKLVKQTLNLEESLTESIIEVLNNSKSPLLPVEILAQLEVSGFKFKPGIKDPYVMVFATCARLAKNQIISSSKQNNKRVFMAK